MDLGVVSPVLCLGCLKAISTPCLRLWGAVLPAGCKRQIFFASILRGLLWPEPSSVCEESDTESRISMLMQRAPGPSLASSPYLGPAWCPTPLPSFFGSPARLDKTRGKKKWVPTYSKLSDLEDLDLQRMAFSLQGTGQAHGPRNASRRNRRDGCSRDGSICWCNLTLPGKKKKKREAITFLDTRSICPGDSCKCTQLPKANRPFNLLVFQFWHPFCVTPKGDHLLFPGLLGK